jgi:hypothetical protein
VEGGYGADHLKRKRQERGRKEEGRRTAKKMRATIGGAALLTTYSGLRHLKEMEGYAKIPPAVNQIEVSTLFSSIDSVLKVSFTHGVSNPPLSTTANLTTSH